jgi:hypothetical protein
MVTGILFSRVEVEKLTGLTPTDFEAEINKPRECKSITEIPTIFAPRSIDAEALQHLQHLQARQINDVSAPLQDQLLQKWQWWILEFSFLYYAPPGDVRSRNPFKRMLTHFWLSRRSFHFENLCYPELNYS